MTVDNKKLIKRINAIKKKLDTNGGASTRQTATLVANRAKLYSPKDSGETAKFIKIIPNQLTKEEKSYYVGYEENGLGKGNPHPEKTWRQGEFSLPLWMHTSRNASKVKWKSGTPKFLYKASADTRKEFESNIRKVVQDALLIKVK